VAAELFALAGRSRAGSRAAPANPLPAPPARSVEIVAPRPLEPAVPAVYHVQVGNKVSRHDEKALVRLIRSGKLTGAELARRDDEDQWEPLFESRIYRREVPTLGDPRAAAGRRVLNAVGGHFTGFFITGVVMYSTQGEVPFWMAIWGSVLGVQTLGTVPAALRLLRARRAGSDAAAADRVLGARQPPPLPLPRPGDAAGVPSAVAQEAARVRTLIEQRGGSEARRLIGEVDGILKLTGELAARQADLEEQTSDRERAALTTAIAQARTRLEGADSSQDRRLFERQLEVLLGREDAIAKARRVLERLRVRREVAEHQLKQLRLDLSRGAASALDVPELSSRLQFIRDEVDAREEVAEIGAERNY
jgi:hypothetical protein